MRKKKTCTAGHQMTTANTYYHSKHGNTYPVCRECRNVRYRQVRKTSGLSRSDQIELSKRPVVAHYNINTLKDCPKCKGQLAQRGEANDPIFCIHCGWRPTSFVQEERHDK